ncbi:MAG TPA: hypothetical protein VFN35_36850 [Ktedonobacteraceae bacterium]|nr:hypothetical protein [Ktedonobacteraceae bacterium]
MPQQEVQLANGEVIQASINRISLDGSEASTYIIPPGNYASLAEYIQAGREVHLLRAQASWIEDEKGDH